jgi:hypothetical protein
MFDIIYMQNYFFLPTFSFVTYLPPPLSGGNAGPAEEFCPPTYMYVLRAIGNQMQVPVPF